MKKELKKILKDLNIYYFLYKLYIPIKKIKNKKRYDLHFSNSTKSLKKCMKKNKIIYVGPPFHNNLGDQAQYYCIKQFLNKYYSNFEIIELMDEIVFMNYKNIVGELKKYVTETDMFVFQSGYRTTDVANFGGEYAHQTILKNFKNKVIVFPQTVNFENKFEARKSMKAYKKNNNYIFLARDAISYNSAKKLYDEKRVLLYPDIVTTLIGNFHQFNKDKNGILLCLRNDDEKLYSNEMYDNLIKQLKNITNTIEVTDTNSKCNFEFNKEIVESEIKSKIDYFSKFKLVITDRYHGTIFSLVSNTKVIVLNSTDHKLSSGVTWFKGRYDEYVTYCEKFNDIYKLAETIYNSNTDEIKKSCFQTEFYDKLKERIDEILQ